MDNTRFSAIIDVMDDLKRERRMQFDKRIEAIGQIDQNERSIRDWKATIEAAEAQMDAIDVALNALAEYARAVGMEEFEAQEEEPEEEPEEEWEELPVDET